MQKNALNLSMVVENDWKERRWSVVAANVEVDTVV